MTGGADRNPHPKPHLPLSKPQDDPLRWPLEPVPPSCASSSPPQTLERPALSRGQAAPHRRITETTPEGRGGQETRPGPAGEGGDEAPAPRGTESDLGVDSCNADLDKHDPGKGGDGQWKLHVCCRQERTERAPGRVEGAEVIQSEAKARGELEGVDGQGKGTPGRGSAGPAPRTPTLQAREPQSGGSFLVHSYLLLSSRAGPCWGLTTLHSMLASSAHCSPPGKGPALSLRFIFTLPCASYEASGRSIFGPLWFHPKNGNSSDPVVWR